MISENLPARKESQGGNQIKRVNLGFGKLDLDKSARVEETMKCMGQT